MTAGLPRSRVPKQARPLALLPRRTDPLNYRGRCVLVSLGEVMTATPNIAPHAHEGAEAASPAAAAPNTGPFVLNLCSSTTPMALAQTDLPELKRFTFFVSRRFEEGRAVAYRSGNDVETVASGQHASMLYDCHGRDARAHSISTNCDNNVCNSLSIWRFVASY